VFENCISASCKSYKFVMDQQLVCSLDLSGAPHDVIIALLGQMELKQRFTCALVCADWARAAAAATDTIVIHDLTQDLTQLQQWLDKHGSQVGTLQLRDCSCTLVRLPCAQLQDLLLRAVAYDAQLLLGSRVWLDISAATKLTSVKLEAVRTISEQADVVSALVALPNLEQLTWREVACGREQQLSDSRLLQHLTRLTGLELQFVAAEALQHLSLLTKLQRLSTHSPYAWAAADYPGLQELQGLTTLELKISWFDSDPQRFPGCVSDLPALQQLGVSWATYQELNGLTALTALTKLEVASLDPSSTALHLPALQDLSLNGDVDDMFLPLLHTSSLASCTQLRCLSLCCFGLKGPGSLVASSMLQELDVQHCSLSSGDEGPAAMSPWEVLFPLGPERLPHLTSLVLRVLSPVPQQADVEHLVSCYSGLRVLHLQSVTDEQCRSWAQLTGLQELEVSDPWPLSAAGLRHLARLEQLTSLTFGLDFDSSKVSTVLITQISDTVVGCKHAIVNKVGADCLLVDCIGCVSS